MAAVDISPRPGAPLSHYVANKESRFVHFSASQSDQGVLEHIVRNEPANEQIMLTGSTSLISEIRVWHFLCLIRKGTNALSRPKGESRSIFDQILSRSKKWTSI